MRDYIRTKNSKGWSSHMPMLLKAMMISKGDVLELGAGLYSTPLLHWMCKSMGRKLTTWDNTDLWYEMAYRYTSPSHRIRKTLDWSEVQPKGHFGVVFVDQHPDEQRGITAIRFKDNADYIVMHDTEKDIQYGYNKVWEHFKYRFDYKGYRPWTSVVSNFKDLNQFSSPL